MKHLIFWTLLVCIAIIACRKDNRDRQIVHKIKTVTHHSGNVDTYNYDIQGRIQKIVSSNGDWKEYTYSERLVIENAYNSSGSILKSTEYQLNADGLVAVSKDILPSPGGPDQYTFTGSRQIGSVVHKDGSNGNTVTSTHNYFYTGQQLDGMHWVNSSGQLKQTWVYEYDPGISNTITEQHMGYRFLGVQSPKAPKRIIIEDYDLINGGVDTYWIDNSYETDGKGRITKRITTSNAGVSITMYTYY